MGPRIEKFDTWYHKAINLGCRLAITLRFLATSERYQSLMYGFRVAHNTISRIVCECCDAIFDKYSAEVMHFPRTSAEWKAVAAEFSSRWNFHHTLGAIDRKHVGITCSRNGGSLYYKGYHSINLFAHVNANYKFIFGGCGHQQIKL